MSCSKVATFLILVLAVALKPILLPNLARMNLSNRDDTIGTVNILTQEGLIRHYMNTTALIIGGTRGVGYGTALAMARAGARVTIVGRNEETGKSAERSLREASPLQPQPQEEDGSVARYIKGDIGTIRSAQALIQTLADQEGVRYNFLVVSAATFPDWDAPNLQNEDGIDKSFFIAVIGRFLVYRNMHRFLSNDARVLNVLASGMKPRKSFDRDIASGKRNVTNLMECCMAFMLGNEIMQILLEKNHDPTIHNTTRVSTHPGVLKTDLHRGQGIVFDLLEFLMVDMTEEECGLRQASILVSDRLHSGGLSYVDQYGIGRESSPQLKGEVEEHGDWLWSLLMELEGRHAGECDSSVDMIQTEL